MKGRNINEKQSRLQEFVDNPSRALWELALPVMAGMGIQTVYTIVDLIFIGRLSGEAIAAVAFNMPLLFLTLGLTMGLGAGVTASIARFIGFKQKAKADNSAEHAIVMAAGISLVLVTFGLAKGPWMLTQFGAEGIIHTYAWEYLRVITIGMPFMVFSAFFRSILAGEGDMKFPMMVAAMGTIINLILDPIMIFTMGLGVMGAALATAISQAIVFFVFIYMMFIKDHAYIQFRMRDFTPSRAIMYDIIKVGIPASLSMIIMAIGQGVFNRILVNFSSEAVAAYQVAGRMDMVIFLPIMSIGTALTTLVGMFYGAHEYLKVRKIVRYGISKAVMITTVLSLLVFIFAPILIKVFTDHESIHAIGVQYLRRITLVYPLIAIGMNIGRVLQGLGKGIPLLMITTIRVLGVSVPLALFFTVVLDKPLEWVWYAMMISTAVAVSTGFMWIRHTFRSLIPLPVEP